MDFENLEKKIISQKHFYISAFIGGPLIAGFVAAYNLWTQKLPWKAIGIFLSGLILTSLLEFFLLLIARFVLSPLKIQLSFGVILIALLSAQILFTWFISLFLRIKKLKAIIFPHKKSYYGKSQVTAIVLLSIAYLIIHIDIPMLFAHFPNMILLFYILPQFYFYNRVKYFFPSQKQIIIARWVVIIIACYMPLVFAGANLLPESLMNTPMFLAESYIYTLLYLFLLVLGIDILVQIGLRLKIIPLTFIRQPITKAATSLAIFLSLIIILISGNNRYNHIIVNEYNIVVEAKDAEIDSLTICFVADMHLNNFTSDQFLDNYVDQVYTLKPDIILYGGDMVEGGRITEEKLKAFDEKLNILKPLYGKYMVIGNHDPSYRNGYYKNADLFILNDSVVKVANSFYLMGLAYRTNEEKPISALNKLAKDNLPVFLLDHSPYQLETAYHNNIDIQLSGHTHYGQVWPINYIIELLYELPWGYKKIQDTHFFVTSGIQGWGTPIRTIGEAEIMMIEVGFVNKESNVMRNR
jgi:hypothetical protein